MECASFIRDSGSIPQSKSMLLRLTDDSKSAVDVSDLGVRSLSPCDSCDGLVLFTESIYELVIYIKLTRILRRKLR